MDLGKQSEDLMNAWLDAQKQWWQTWQGMFGEATSPYQRMFEQWQQLTQQSLTSWTGHESITKQVAGQFVASQGAMFQFVELTLNAWNDLAPQIEAGEDWQHSLHKYIEQLRGQFLQSQAGMTQAAEEMTDLWSVYVEEMQQMGAVWLEPLKHSPWALGHAASGRGSDLVDLTNLYWEAFERTFGALLQSPSLGYTRELNEKITAGFDTWLHFRRASADYQAKLADAWTDAFDVLIHEMADRAEQGEMIGSVRDLLLLWGQVADRVFIDTFRTDEFIQIQGQFLQAAMTYRIQQREIAEASLSLYDLPTRSEVDEAHRNIYELRKEVKALKKALADLQKPKPRRTTRAKPANATQENQEG
jgi:class III poly(R)-hydroxyalkanoic acid synthase PhaE subunit